ncbi:MAG TPA: inorganic phosphate transporter [Bacteroidales bacterium]|nr:inorganic phosphate transporter [Bacteroidales bacterium]HPT21219.1 inorganic phosphate transporter [Bacteroidales bacterium]
MIILYLTSGLFLGWSLGANDASHIFGSAVGSKMISFRTAAVIASVFFILGAVIQGSGTSNTLSKLGAVNAIGGSFTVALAAAITIYMMTKFSLPISTTQAIVGAIIGWNIFTGNPTHSATLTKIVAAWIAGPVIGAVFAIILYILLKRFKKSAKIHLIKFESYIKTGLLIVGAFGAYSLGANNIANVMGVFIPAFHLQDLNLGIFTLSSTQQILLLGGLAVAAGILTYSWKVMETIGSNIMELSSDAALIVVLAQSLVLFIFSSTGLSDLFVRAGLPPIPMVPVSSSQVIVGCILGIGLYKGARNINFKVLRDIGLAWVVSPVVSGLLTFFLLFFMKNIFNMNVGTKITGAAGNPLLMNDILMQDQSDVSGIIRYILLGLFVFGTIALLLYFLLESKKRKEMQRSEEKFWKNLK